MRLLVLAHGHPDHQPGGTEVMARGLFRTLRDAFGVEGEFLAACTSRQHDGLPGTLLRQAGPQVDEVLVWLDRFDRFFLSQPDSFGLAALAQRVRRLRPDVIHLHHLLQWGTETLDALRRAAPRAKLVLTLHDYFLLCPREGQLLDAEDRPCAGPRLDSCRRCLPEQGEVAHALRAQSLRDACRAVDAFIAPSAFLRDRFIAAGWDAARIHLLRNGIAAAPPAPPRPAPDGRRDRFAIFGNLNRFKGTLVALEASARLSAASVAHGLALHGGAAAQGEGFRQALAAALAAAPDATSAGPYAAAELPTRIAAADWVVVPSLWWENAPLVILEAFRHGRPVLCSSIGGMAELVTDGGNGLHAQAGDAAGLARVMQRAATEPGLWERLRVGIQNPHDLRVAAEAHLDLYRRLRAEGGSTDRRHARSA